jgi:DNA-binding transcriptional LysR family regulator
MMHRLEATCARITDLQERPSGTLRVTTTLALGTNWLTPRLNDFLKLYPEIHLELILWDEELDLPARQADIGIRLRSSDQPNLIQKRLFTVHFHVYASKSYLERYGIPHSIQDLDHHSLLGFGGEGVPDYISIPWFPTVGQSTMKKRPLLFEVNNLTALKKATEQGFGLAILPDYLVDTDSNLVKILSDCSVPSLECYLIYPEGVRNVARVQVFRDFLVTKARGWVY